MPQHLREKVIAMVDDRDLMSLRDEIATVGALVADALASEDDDRVVALIEQRRKLVNTERRRVETMQVSMTAAEAFAFVDAVVEAVSEHVRDPVALTAISDDLARILNRDAT